ncbi:MAG: phosphoglycerate kinase, partial [Erysipelotrichaceae bacterium]
SFLAIAGNKIILPVDFMVAAEFSETADHYLVDADHIPSNYMGLDIGPKSIELFKKELQGAKTVVWNGPMGVFEMKPYAYGTIEVCKIMAALPNAFTVIGGGDSAAAAIENGFEKSFSHISTGGGASLEFMEGKELPGIAVIQDK